KPIGCPPIPRANSNFSSACTGPRRRCSITAGSCPTSSASSRRSEVRRSNRSRHRLCENTVLSKRMNMMRTGIFLTAAALAVLCHQSAFAQNAASYTFEQGYPTPETTQRARDDADFQRAVTAYRFWYPTVSVEGIFNGNRELGLKDGEKMGIAAAGPR